MQVNALMLVEQANNWLQPQIYKDYCDNGLQVASINKSVRLIASAVTACQAAIQEAAAIGADALLVHHGLFWKGDSQTITGITFERVKSLIDNHIALIAYHLPLDEHKVFGNNAQLGFALGIDANLQHDLGIMQPSLGRFADFEIEFDILLAQLKKIMAQNVNCFDFGPSKIKRLAWCTGAAQDGIVQAYQQGADSYISGEVSERTFHYAKEFGMNYFCVGHHASERFGVQVLGDALASEFSIEHKYIEVFNPV